ncbi:MAG: hypothetical protein HZC12_09870 [Nitrospirae bacterium]|nr:hypothetical protein [Nitrospirota bacterium]
MDKIEASTKVHEIMKEFPELTDYLLELGLCGCGFGDENTLTWNVVKVADEKGMDLKVLLNELNRRIRI